MGGGTVVYGPQDGKWAICWEHFETTEEMLLL